MRRPDLVWCELRFPAEMEAELAVAWLRSLAARGRAGWWSVVQPLVFELRLDAAGARDVYKRQVFASLSRF